MMINILIAEDNRDLRELMGITLRREGYNVIEASDGNVALEKLDHHNVHLIVADIMMPRIDGYDLTKAIRNSGSKIPVLMVTARESLEDKRKAFGNGADDYMVKPIEMDELIMRVQALLRRANIASQKVLRIGGCEINEETLSVVSDGISVDLRLKEFQVLYKLLSYPDKIFTRHALMDEIWGYDNESTPRTVDVHIMRLREKVEFIPYFEIQTVRGLGYRAVIKA